MNISILALTSQKIVNDWLTLVNVDFIINGDLGDELKYY